MPKPMKNFKFAGEGSTKYDWDSCIKQPMLFERGKDFKVEPVNFRSVAYAAAKRIGYRARVSIREEGVIIQFVSRNGEKP